MKRLISLASVVALIFVLCASVNAVDVRRSAPRLTLTFSGTTASCKAIITSSGQIDATMALKQGDTVIDSWSDSGRLTVCLEGECTVTKGVTYTLEVSGTANGVPFSLTKTGRC